MSEWKECKLGEVVISNNKSVGRGYPHHLIQYLDDSVLTHLTKRKKNVSVTLLTRNISRQLALDVEKFNKQYPPIEIKEFKNAHDRFIIIDNATVYHFGASLKDLGKKWFAFSKMDIGTVEMLTKPEEIDRMMKKRQGKALTNFERTLPMESYIGQHITDPEGISI